MLRLAKKSVGISGHSKCFAGSICKSPWVQKRNRSTLSDPDFLHESLLPTDHFQKSLPRLPIPKLEDTCSRYLKSQKPLLSAEDYGRTEKIVSDFQNGVGRGPWFDMYLRDRRAICLNQNPFMAFIDDPKPEYNDQVIRATNFLVSSARFMKTLRANVLEPEVFHLNPAKTDNLKFRRVMRPEKDELSGDPTARHIVVLRKGNFYTFDLLDKDGAVLAPAEVLAHVQYILSDQTPAADHPVAVLTSQPRDKWSDLRQQLVSAGNEEVLRQIDTGLFVLALDDDNLEDHETLSRSFLHGNGTNRWFDKSFSLMMSANGKASVNFEHAWGDGVAVLRYFNEVFKHATENPSVHPDTKPANVDSEFTIPDSVKQGIKESLVDFKETVSDLAMDFLQHMEHSKKDIKKYKLSPDSFLQLAIQMGYYREFGGTVPTYESCSTAAFRHGRTETIRPATTATQLACQMFDKSAGTLPGVSELQNALKECSTVHGQLTKEAAMGQGFDRHLFGLKYLASERGGSLPDLYQDSAYTNINHIILSTSTLSSPAVLIGGFAPVVADGYGVGYAVDDEFLGCNITAYPNNPPHRKPDRLVRAIEQSIIDMANVMEGKSPN